MGRTTTNEISVIGKKLPRVNEEVAPEVLQGIIDNVVALLRLQMSAPGVVDEEFGKVQSLARRLVATLGSTVKTALVNATVQDVGSFKIPAGKDAQNTLKALVQKRFPDFDVHVTVASPQKVEEAKDGKPEIYGQWASVQMMAAIGDQGSVLRIEFDLSSLHGLKQPMEWQVLNRRPPTLFFQDGDDVCEVRYSIRGAAPRLQFLVMPKINQTHVELETRTMTASLGGDVLAYESSKTVKHLGVGDVAYPESMVRTAPKHRELKTVTVDPSSGKVTVMGKVSFGWQKAPPPVSYSRSDTIRDVRDLLEE